VWTESSKNERKTRKEARDRKPLNETFWAGFAVGFVFFFVVCFRIASPIGMETSSESEPVNQGRTNEIILEGTRRCGTYLTYEYNPRKVED
jgi:hypothetical protein